jgi:signal transduction histidine kinase
MPLSYGSIMLLGILLFFVTKNLGVFVSVSSFFMLLVPLLCDEHWRRRHDCIWHDPVFLSIRLAKTGDDQKAERDPLQFIEKNSVAITEATERISTIVNNLKDFARLDEAEFQDADLHAGLDTTLTLMQHEFGNSMQLGREYGELPTVPCRPNQLTQVFMALFARAVESIDGAGSITIRTFAEGGSGGGHENITVVNKHVVG